jgi:hypothetical protein
MHSPYGILRTVFLTNDLGRAFEWVVTADQERQLDCGDKPVKSHVDGLLCIHWISSLKKGLNQNMG